MNCGALFVPDRLLAYRHSEVMLPREAVLWTISEVDVFLGSLGFIRPGRESSMMRSSKRLVRAVRGGYKPLEFRVDQSGKESGVFSSGDIAKGDLVELCPLHEVPARLRAISAVLQRITVPMRCDQSRCAIVLGFGKDISSMFHCGPMMLHVCLVAMVAHRRASPSPRARRRTATPQSPTDTATPPYMQRAPKPIFMSEDGNDKVAVRSPKSASRSPTRPSRATHSSRTKTGPANHKAQRSPSGSLSRDHCSPHLKPADWMVPKSRNASSPKYVTLEGIMVYRSTKRNPSQRKYVMLEGVMMATRSTSQSPGQSRSPSLAPPSDRVARSSSRSPSRGRLHATKVAHKEVVVPSSPSCSPKSPLRSLSRSGARHASGFLKLEAHAQNRISRIRSASPPNLKPPVQSPSELPAGRGAGFSFWTQKQREDGETEKMAKDWGLSFDRSSRTKRAAAYCWSRDHSLRTQPEQWWLDEALNQEARVDGRLIDWAWCPVGSAWRSQTRSPSPERGFHSLPGTPFRNSSHAGSPVPRPIPMEVISPFTVTHPEWGLTGYTIGRSNRLIREPAPRQSRSHSPTARPR
eukprot:s560_g4.t1